MTCVIVKLAGASQVDQKWVQAYKEFEDLILAAMKRFDEINRGKENMRGVCDCPPAAVVGSMVNEDPIKPYLYLLDGAGIEAKQHWILAKLAELYPKPEPVPEPEEPEGKKQPSQVGFLTPCSFVFV